MLLETPYIKNTTIPKKKKKSHLRSTTIFALFFGVLHAIFSSLGQDGTSAERGRPALTANQSRQTSGLRQWDAEFWITCLVGTDPTPYGSLVLQDESFSCRKCMIQSAAAKMRKNCLYGSGWERKAMQEKLENRGLNAMHTYS